MVANQAINTSSGTDHQNTVKKTGSSPANRNWHRPSHVDPRVEYREGKGKGNANENSKEIGMAVYKCLPSIWEGTEMEIEDKQSMPHYYLTTCTQACFYTPVSLLWETNFGLFVILPILQAEVSSFLISVPIPFFSICLSCLYFTQIFPIALWIYFASSAGSTWVPQKWVG